MQLKQKIHQACLKILDKKIDVLNHTLNTASEAANNETKSSAGDKHETARAMMQLEQEKLGRQLKEVLDQKAELEKIDLSKVSSHVTRGSLIQSDKGLLFVAIGIGKVIVDEQTVFVISPQSPLGKLVSGKKEKDMVEMNGVTYFIEKLF